MAFPEGFTLKEVLAGDEAGLNDIRTLFKAHAAMLMTMGVNLQETQGFDDELAGLPGKYSPALGGRLFLLRHISSDGTGTPAGSIAFYAFGPNVTELKRLFVNPTYRGLRLGEALSSTAIAAAKEMGYTRAILDTLERLPHARRLYESLGFTAIERYNDNPLPDILFFGKDI